MVVLVIGGAVVANAPPAAAAGSITAFTLDSEPGDYIGEGQTFTFTSENATITSATLPDGGVELAAVQGANVHRFYADIARPWAERSPPGRPTRRPVPRPMRRRPGSTCTATAVAATWPTARCT
jgi:hypothetical protein